jgi:hypothetical protein
VARLDLSPRDVGRVLDDAIAAYRANLKAIASAALLAVFPVALIYSVAQVFYYRGMLDMVSLIGANPNATPQPGPEMLAIYALSGSAGLAYVAAQVLFRGALYRSGAKLFEGGEIGWRELLRGGLATFLPLAGVYFLNSFAVALAGGLSLLALGIGGAVAAAFFAVAGPAVVVERTGVIDAFKRSAVLVRRNFWRVATLFAALALVLWQLESALASPIIIRDVVLAMRSPGRIFPAVPVYWKFLEGVIQAVAVVIVMPIADLAWFRCYMDLRSRNEGMDLLARAHDLTPGAR